MNNGLIIDGMLVLLLLVSFFVGAKRGLFKSLMGLVVVIAAILGAAVIAGKLTEPVTDFLLPRVEEKVSSWLAVPEHMTMQDFTADSVSSDSPVNPGLSGWFEKMEQWGSGDRFLGHLREGAADAAQTAVRSLVESVVHTALLLLGFVILLILLKLLAGLIDHVFDLPGLHALNTVGGGIFGLLEAVVLIYLILWIAPKLGITFFRDHAGAACLLKFFMTHTPFTVISTIASLNGGN